MSWLGFTNIGFVWICRKSKVKLVVAYDIKGEMLLCDIEMWIATWELELEDNALCGLRLEMCRNGPSRDRTRIQL